MTFFKDLVTNFINLFYSKINNKKPNEKNDDIVIFNKNII